MSGAHPGVAQPTEIRVRYGSDLVSRSPSREYRREVSGVAAARATTAACPTISVASRARVIAV